MSYETAITIKDAINNIKKKRYVLPSIQREFVWKTSQIEVLFDSLMRDYPIGTFLFWQVDKDKIKDFEFYEFLDKYHEKNYRHNKKANLSSDEDVIALLDGQQRMTSMFLALCGGGYSIKKKHARKDDLGTYQEKYLFLNLLKKSDNPEMEYDFRFLTKEDAKKSEDFWFQCSEILSLDDPTKPSRYLMKNGLMDSSKYEEKESNYAMDALNRLFNVIHQKGTISFFLEKGEELDKVLQIFIRINSGGTKLSYSDLLLSVATAQWNEKDAREVIHEFVDEINEIGDGFNFNKDIVLKSCLVLGGFPDIHFKVDNFTKYNMSETEKCWDKISDSIRKTVHLIASFGYNSDNLLATNVIVPIAYFVYKNNFESSILQSSNRKDDRKSIREWLARVLLKGVFGGTPDSIYPVMRKLIDENRDKFPLPEIIERYRGDRRNILFSEDEIEGLLDLQYGDPKTYCALTLLYPTLNHNFRFHQDHIHPKSLFNKKKLSELGISKEKLDNYISGVNDISNLQLISSTQNSEKKNKHFTDWINGKFVTEQEKNSYLLQNYIDLKQNMNFNNFLEFLHNRRAKLKTELMTILGVK